MTIMESLLAAQFEFVEMLMVKMWASLSEEVMMMKWMVRWFAEA